MGRHTGSVSGAAYGPLLFEAHLEPATSPDLLFVTAKCVDVTLLSQYTVEARNGAFLFRLFPQTSGCAGALFAGTITQLSNAALFANTFSLKSTNVSCQQGVIFR